MGPHENFGQRLVDNADSPFHAPLFAVDQEIKVWSLDSFAYPLRAPVIWCILEKGDACATKCQHAAKPMPLTASRRLLDGTESIRRVQYGLVFSSWWVV